MPSVHTSLSKPIPLPRGAESVIVIIADSDTATVTALQASLESGGYTVLIADTGEQLINDVRDQQPHIVILGKVEDSDPRRLCRLIKLDDSAGFVPIIRLVTRKPRRSVPDTGPDVVLTKPIDLDVLTDQLWLLYGLKRQFDRRLQKLATKARAVELLKTDIIANVSHELGTPLLQVKSAVSLLAEEVTQKGVHEETRVADMATQAVARLESVVNNIRQLARTHNIHLGPVVLDEAADLAIRHLARSWASRGRRARVEKHLDPDLPLVLGDKRALGHLLQLLLDNALKFSPPDTAVHIVAEPHDQDHVWIGVQDYGIGIPAEEHARIFDAFYQVDGSTTRRYGGTGTGLALAMLLANGMNTTVQLDSAPGEGSTFWFVLPVTDLDALY